jgi:moderate conductance mechanosensitive channel
MAETPEVDTQQLEQWFDANVVVLLIIAVLLLALYAYSARIVHAAVSRALATQMGQVEAGSPEAAELAKRSATLADLVTALLRIIVVAIIVTLIIGFFGLWSLLAGLGLFLAALTLAGQSIVLDYLMGILIILEGQYFKGDVIGVGAVAGTVEDVGLRRTTIRAPDGTVHSVSNGEIRVVSNRTRVYAAAEVTIPGIREEDFDRVLEIMDRVGQEVARDPALAASIIEAPAVQFIGDPDDLGMSATMRGKVVAGDRWAVATETRKRLNRAFVEEGIELNKRGVAPRLSRAPGSEPPPYVPEPGDE